MRRIQRQQLGRIILGKNLGFAELRTNKMFCCELWNQLL